MEIGPIKWKSVRTTEHKIVSIIDVNIVGVGNRSEQIMEVEQMKFDRNKWNQSENKW